jgi:sirohydrochlorin cobaltochelatase
MTESSTPPATSAAVQQAEERLQTLLPGIYRGRTDEVRPISMGSAPLAFDIDGNVEWDRMWGSFCDLAMAGGPPHKGNLLEAGTQESIRAAPERYAKVCDEIVRGVALAARLRAEPSSLQGWLRVACKSHTMAAWMLRAITMENISVRLEECAILLPAGPAFRVEKEIKNVITVAAKTTHYWSSHLIRLQQLGIANLFHQLESGTPLLQPAWCAGAEDANGRERIQRALEDATGLRITNHGYADWIGLDCGSVPSAITTMRRLVASNILCRREETAIFLPLNPAADPHGARLAHSVAELLARDIPTFVVASSTCARLPAPFQRGASTPS